MHCWEILGPRLGALSAAVSTVSRAAERASLFDDDMTLWFLQTSKAVFSCFEARVPWWEVTRLEPLSSLNCDDKHKIPSQTLVGPATLTPVAFVANSERRSARVVGLTAVDQAPARDPSRCLRSQSILSVREEGGPVRERRRSLARCFFLFSGWAPALLRYLHSMFGWTIPKFIEPE